MNSNDIRNELIQLYFESHNVSLDKANEIVDEMIEFGINPIQFRNHLIEQVEFKRRYDVINEMYDADRPVINSYHNYLDEVARKRTRAYIEWELHIADNI